MSTGSTISHVLFLAFFLSHANISRAKEKELPLCSSLVGIGKVCTTTHYLVTIARFSNSRAEPVSRSHLELKATASIYYNKKYF